MDIYHINLRCNLHKSLGGPIMNFSMLFGIREILCVGDLQLPVLFNQSEEDERIVLELVTIGSVERETALCSPLLLSETT